MEFGFGAYFLALLCIFISSLVLSAFLCESPRCWLSLVCKACIYLFNQLHSNTFLANSIEEPDVLLARLERGKRPGQDLKSWYGLSWPFGARGREYTRPPVTLGKLLHSRQNSDQGIVKPVVKSCPNGITGEPNGNGSVGQAYGRNGKHKSKH
jgi:hypothetical protein